MTLGKGFHLRDHEPGSAGRMGSEDKPEASELPERAVDWLARQQDTLYAQDRRSRLLEYER